MSVRYNTHSAAWIAALFFMMTCVSCSGVGSSESRAAPHDRELEESIRAIEDALADLDVEEADAAYEIARRRLLLMADIPYSRKTAEAYHPKFVDLAKSIIEAKTLARGLVRVMLYRGYDPIEMKAEGGVYRVGSLFERLQAAPPERRAEVERMIAHYLGSGRGQYRIYLRRMAKYRNHIERVLSAYGLPQELLCVAMIESAGDPTRVSHAGAAGLWQFIPETARRYKLVVGRNVDQRYDPVLETYAAAAYFRDLLDMFGGDLESALASYNAGESFIADAVQSTGGRGFWSLSPHGAGGGDMLTIPRETYDYVARFYAVGIIYQNLDRYGFDQPPADDDPFVMLDFAGPLELDQLSVDLGLDSERVRAMNTSLLVTDSGADTRALVRLPAAPIDAYVAMLRATRHYRVSYIYRHRVTNYESLRAIAEDYGVSPSRIAVHNNLDTAQRLKPGMILQVPASMNNVRAAAASERNLTWWREFRDRNQSAPPGG